MKKVFLLLLIICFSFTKNNESDIDLHIINIGIKDNEKVNFQIKNNSKDDLCFILDTIFPERSKNYYYYLNSFLNPQLIIIDNQNRINSRWVKDISYDENYQNNLNLSKNNNSIEEDRLRLILVKSKTKVNFSIPFNLVKNIDKGTMMYYKLDNKKKYKCFIEYFIKKEFISKRISSRVVDSIENKGYKFFTGKLVSNKVPLVLK